MEQETTSNEQIIPTNINFLFHSVFINSTNCIRNYETLSEFSKQITTFSVLNCSNVLNHNAETLYMQIVIQVHEK